ncbi:AprI/Inh family metalloprotease inhibitor [Caulobacter sp. KR2-114]|uniref:AprI/Inh family metalloprotease inhibitor n=1 Tax=Caulobacter sp. KR2-114 TaxID=3400912 RepID=UPI003C087B70
MSPDNLRHLAIAAFAWTCLPGLAVAEDHEAGVPLVPAEAAGTWSLSSGGADICRVTLGGAKAGNAGFSANAPAACGEALPPGIAGWTPTGDGMALTATDGKVLIAFNRWSNSLFVSHRSSGADLQLRRQ